MPELPEVETVRKGLEAALTGQVIKRVTLYRPDLRYPFPARLAEILEGVEISAVGRRAKYLLFDIGAHRLIGHLGMTGTYVVRPIGSLPVQPHDHMVWQLENGVEVVYHDPRRFGFLLQNTHEVAASHPLLAMLGVEPLGEGLNAAFLQERMKGRQMPIKSFLMDQRFIAGIGNIYACEALFTAKIHPGQSTVSCSGHAAILVQAIKEVLLAALDSGGSTLRNYANASGEKGYFQHRFQVYGRAGKPCFQCTTLIERIVQAGRSSFFCPSCQAMHKP